MSCRDGLCLEWAREYLARAGFRVCLGWQVSPVTDFRLWSAPRRGNSARRAPVLATCLVHAREWVSGEDCRRLLTLP